MPFDHPLKKEAFLLAEKVAESFAGLCGYIGVDLILGQTGVSVVDVNPRLTTSYVGLRQVSRFNVAEAMLDAVLDGRLPRETANPNVTCFSKMETPKPTQSAFQKISQLASVVSPPFPLSKGKACSLLMGCGVGLEQASSRLEETKKRVRNIIS